VFGVADPDNVGKNEIEKLKKQKDELIIQSLKNREKREERREEREMRREAREVARFNDYQANMVAKMIEKKLEIEEQKRKLNNIIENKKEESNEEYIERKKQEIQNNIGIAKGRYAPIIQRRNDYQYKNYNNGINNQNKYLLPEGAQGVRKGDIVGLKKEFEACMQKLKELRHTNDLQFLDEQGCVDPLFKKCKDLQNQIQTISASLQEDPTAGKSRHQHYHRNNHRRGKRWNQNNNGKKRRPPNHY